MLIADVGLWDMDVTGPVDNAEWLADDAVDSDADSDDGLGALPTDQSASLEGKMLQSLHDSVDHMLINEAEVMLAGSSRDSAIMQKHIGDLFTTNTEEGTRTKVADWALFMSVVYKCNYPLMEDMQWPPDKDTWVRFLLEGRKRVFSYKRLLHVIGTVCNVAVRYWQAKRSDIDRKHIDPRQKYALEHSRTLTLIGREYGVDCLQVEAITMVEARNAARFADVESVRGIAAIVAFTLGSLLGGRRARSLTAIRLRHVKLSVVSVFVAGEKVAVPSVHVTFTDEKFADVRGPREGQDVPHEEGYVDKLWSNCSYWLYRFLVIRGVFEKFDPILHATSGQLLTIKPECNDYFLFCEASANFWVDAAPVSVGTLSQWNRQLLVRMGSRPRGFSAHRSGFMSRSCILGVLEAQGTKLPEGLINIIARLGGWSTVSGDTTVMSVYARKVIDNHLMLLVWGTNWALRVGKPGWSNT